jgi:predicted nucleotidyltransferase
LPVILFGDHTRVFKFLDFPFATGADGTKLLRAAESVIDPLFLYYALLALDIPSRGYSRHFRYLREQTVPVPNSQAEQQDIARILSALQAAVAAQEKIVLTLKELKAATMAKLFREGRRGHGADVRETDFGEVPTTWGTARLGEVAHIQTGVAKGRRLDGRSPIVEVPYLRVANVQDGYLDLGEIKTIELRESEIERYRLQVGDVLLTEGGDFDKLGRGYLWHGQIPGCVHQNHIFAVRADGSRLRPDFLAYLVQSRYGRAYFAHKTTNLASINASKLKAFPVLLPALEEQAEIAAALGAIDQTLEAQGRRLGTLRVLFASMLRLLMSGRLRVPPPPEPMAPAATETKSRPDEPVGWKMRAESVDRFVSELVQRFEVERVTLFGRHAEGSPTAFGEVGLLVEMEFEGLARDRAAEIAHAIPHDFSLDLVVRRPEDVRCAIEVGDEFIGGIVAKGRVLYARPPGEPPAVPGQGPARTRPRRVLSEEMLGEIVRRIVEAVHPVQIILFGSAARGEMGPDSDVDLLVVKECADRREVAWKARQALAAVAVGLPKDIIVVTPADIERDRDTVGYIIRPALREGRVVYAA